MRCSKKPLIERLPSSTIPSTSALGTHTLGPWRSVQRVDGRRGWSGIWVLQNRLAMNAHEADARNLRVCGDDNALCRRLVSFANYQHRAMGMANHRIGDAAH